MNSLKALSTRIQNLTNPGYAWNTQGSSKGSNSNIVNSIGTGNYFVWSGPVYTKHTILQFSVNNHGFGSELS